MTEQLRLDLEEAAPPVSVSGQLRDLPGTTWWDIFGVPHDPAEGHEVPLHMSPDPDSVELP